MKLADFFGTITPFLAGHASHDEATRTLYPAQPEGRDARRLAVYGRICRGHRFEVLEKLYPHCWREVRERHGEAAWEALVEDYFRAHPMNVFELNANGAHLPGFLARDAAEKGLPAWLAELADLEWWEWEVLVAPDREVPGPRPCLAPTVELRPYAHDLVGWLDADARAEAPEEAETLVLFWREGDQFRRENVSPVELWVLKALHEGLGLEALAAQAEGVTLEELESTLEDLTAAGIVLGLDSDP